MRKRQWRMKALFLAVVLLLSGFSMTSLVVDGAATAWSYSQTDVDSTTDGEQYFSTGNGTSGSPYEIDTAQELANLSYLVNNSVPGYNTASYKLTADIVLNDWTDDGDGTPEDGELSNNSGSVLHWTPIGTSAVKFSGSFNGNSHTISGIYIKKTGTDQTNNYQGLFGNVENGTIYNLTVSEGYIFGFGYIGGITGNLAGSGTIDNCRNECTVVGRGYDYAYGSYGGVGGIAGFSSGTVSNCQNIGGISSQKPGTCTSSSSERIGGIVGGNIGGTVSGCSNSGAINCTSVYTNYAGGIVGTNEYNAIIRNSYNTGNISASNYAGGIVGESKAWNGPVIVENCFNTGSITATWHAGGIAGSAIGGYSDSSGTSLVQYCYNAGNLSSYGSGGIVGFNWKYYPETATTSKVQYCYNTGTMSGSGSGSVVGRNINSASVEDCFYDMQMSTYKGMGDTASDTPGQTEGRPTSAMISSGLADIFDSAGANFIYTDGLYPRLEGMEVSDAAYVSVSPVYLSGTNTAAIIDRNFTLSTLNGVGWSSDNSGAVSIDGGNAAFIDGNGTAVNLTASLNGLKKTVRVMPCVDILEAGVAGITAPLAGVLPQSSGSLTAGHASYTVTGISWKDSDGTTPATLLNGKFKVETVYKAVIELKAGAGYRFKTLTPSVNVGTAAAGAVDIAEAGNKLTFMVTFPATGAREVMGIVVSAQPAKMSYTQGTDGILALNGMVVTEEYNDGTTELVTFTDGTAEGYTTNPSNGTSLTFSGHNTKVTVTHTASGRTAQTGALAVAVADGSSLNLSEWTSGDTINIPAGSNYTITGSRSNTKIVCGAGVSLTLDKVSITNTATGYSPVTFTGGNNILIITGSNSLSAGPTGPGINVSGASLNIRGTGSLAVTGGRGYEPGGPGIGSKRGEAGGNITIESGVIVATAGDSGRKSPYKGGEGICAKTIDITDGTVIANGNGSAAGIGGGYSVNGSVVTISGGKVTANGSGGAVGIGFWGSGSVNGNMINISGGRVIASSAGGYGTGIGGSSVITNSGSILLTGGEIFANRNGAYNTGDIGNSISGSSWTLGISGTAAVFLRNDDCIAPVTTTHNHETFTDTTTVYGVSIPTEWTGTFGAYLSHPTLSYDLNGGEGSLPASVIQLAGTTATVAQSDGFSWTGHVFTGWNTEEDVSGYVYQPGDTLTFENDNIILFAQWGGKLSAAGITGITAPVAGEVPQEVGSLTAGNSNYSVTKLTWQDGDGSQATLTNEGKFKASSTYKAVIELTAAAGFRFQALTPTVDAGSAGAGAISEDAEGNRLTFEVSFNPTAAKALTGIEVTTQPKLIYTEGTDGTLELDGMVVTEMYNDDTTGVVTFTGGTASGYTTSPDNGATLTNAAHDNARIIVTHTASGETAQTNELTVAEEPTAVKPGILDFSSDAYSVGEDEDSITITVTRTGGSDGAVSVDYATSDGTAIDGSDYTAASGTLSFADGDEASKTFTIDIIQDDLLESNEDVNLILSDSTGGATLGQNTSVLTINDDEVAQPGIPTILSADPGDGQVSLSWSEVPAPNGFNVYSSTTSGEYTDPPTVFEAVYSCDVTGLTNGTAYYFKVAAVGTDGESAYSNQVTATPRTVPGAPTDVIATAGNRKATVSFTPPEDNGGNAITGYRVTSSPGNIMAAGNDTTITVTGLTNGTTYTFTVTSTNAAGTGPASAASNEVTPNSPPIDDDEDEDEDEDKDDSGTPSAPVPPTQGTNTGIDILVNGETTTAATSTSTQEGDKTITTVVVDDKIVTEKLMQEGNKAIVTIPALSGADIVIGQLNGQTIKNMETKEAVLEIRTGLVTYTLPASQINIDAVSEQIGKQVELKDITVSVKISEPTAETIKIVEDTANKNNYQIIVEPIEFEITCSSGNKTVEVSKFNAYVERLIAIPEGIDPSKITTGIILNEDGSFSHVPTVITVIDGRYYAKINSLTNSVYSVISSQRSFVDVENHWAKDAINDMASRLVMVGESDGLLYPDKDITRAEFASIVIKALGLMRTGSGKDFFNDVVKKDWYYDSISIAHEYGIISGYSNGSFGPEDTITREQAMTMIARAMKITKLTVGFEAGEEEQLLAAFSDAGQDSGWAKSSIASSIKAGIVSGRNGKRIAPKDNITRAEAAVIIRRLLQKSGLI